MIYRKNYPILSSWKEDFRENILNWKFTFKGFALNQIQIVRLLQNSTFETTAQTLQVATVDVKQKSSHFKLKMIDLIETFLSKMIFFQRNKNSHKIFLPDVVLWVMGRQIVIWLDTIMNEEWRFEVFG